MRTLVTISNSELRQLFFHDRTLRKLESISEVDFIPMGEPFTSADLADIIDRYDACITSWGSARFTPEVIERAVRLKLIGHAAGSVVAVVNEDIFDTGIAVTCANKPLAVSTAECAVALILAGAWDLHGYNLRFKQGQWSANHRDTVLGVTGRTIGIIGYGEISRHVIRYLQVFQPRILLHSRHCSKDEADRMGVELCSLTDLLQQSDIVSLHNTWTPQTEGMIGREQLAMLKDGALFVNTARGRIVDETALVEEIQTGRIFAALDVYHTEPLPASHALLQLPNVFASPHIGGFHRDYKSRFGEYITEELDRFIRGEDLQGQVTREVYRRLTPR